MAATQTLGDDVWTHDTASPKVSDVLNQVAEFLSAAGFKKTLKAIEKEAKGDGFEIDLEAWKKTVEDGSAPTLTQLWHQWQAKKSGKEETEDDSSSASSDSDSSSASDSDSSSASGSEDSDSDSDSEGEGMVVDVKATVDSDDGSSASSSESEEEEKPKAKTTSSKRKRSPSPSSSEASSSDDSSSSDSDAPPAKKRVVEKASRGSSSDSSSSDSSSDSSSASSSSSGSSSDSSSSDSEAPAPKKKDSEKESKKDTKEKKPKKEDKKEKKSSKSESNSAASSATLGRDSPVDVVIAPTTSADSTSAEDSTAGMHPARLAMIDGGKPKAAAVAVVTGKKGKKQNVPFSRISADQYIDPRLASNAYVPYDYADRAHRDLIVTKGKGFTKEKNKKKRGSYRGGAIDLAPKGFKFDD